VKHSNRRTGCGHGLAAPPRNGHYCPHQFPRRVHGPPPAPDFPTATAVLVPSSPCDSATAFCPSSTLFSSVGIEIRFGPVTNGLRNSPTGSKGRYIQVLATRLVIASTGAMLIVGHEAPCRISALACRIESRDHTGKEGPSRQVSGTSDASKTQLSRSLRVE
jgi:hypothetical protein